MNKKEIIEYIERRIKQCYQELRFFRNHNFTKYSEDYRNRLDELLLTHQHIKNQCFIKSCKELKINYEDVNIQDASDKDGGTK